ncbi:MAG TPA: hypothetical protein VK956_19805 [Verrucomicrobium sp.]|nr:hypothetical protein [Verrucomicrobium sp.]
MNTISPPANIIAFRELLQSKFPGAHPVRKERVETWSTGVSCLDAAGLQRGTVTEIVGTGISPGVGLLMAALLQRETAVAEYTAVVDGSDAFDPWSVPAAHLDRLLWVRCQQTTQAIKAADLLLRDGNIPLVVLDLQLYAPRDLLRLPSSVWHRLRMLGEKSGVTTCIFTPSPTISCAATRLTLDQSFTLADQDRLRSDALQALRTRQDGFRAAHDLVRAG